MVDVISVVLAVIEEIVKIGDEMEEVGTQAARLARRLAELEGPVKQIKKSVEEGKGIYPETNFKRLENLVTEGHDFLQTLKGRKLLGKVMKRRSDLERFQTLTEDFKEVVQIFSFNLNVRAWEQENERDRENDGRRLLHIEKMLEEQQTGFEKAKEEIIVEQKKMHEEVLSHLQQQCAVDADVAGRTTDTLQKPRNWTEINTSDIELEGDQGNLGHGSSGVVKLARWHGARVAVKIILDPDGSVARKIRKLLRELRIHQSLQHELITQMYGASTSQLHVWLVMEYARMGSLYGYLKRSTEPLKPELQLGFLSDIARGMYFLHSQRILHCDLKSDNVLMFDNGRLKLCDFGMAKVMQESISLLSGRAGTVGWQAPEIIDEKPPTEKTDLYSFGMVCYEVVTCKPPFEGRKLYEIMATVARGERPQIPEFSSPGIVKLMQRCWAQNPDDRPVSFKDVVEELDRLLEEAGGDPRQRLRHEFVPEQDRNDPSSGGGVERAESVPAGTTQYQERRRGGSRQGFLTLSGSSGELELCMFGENERSARGILRSESSSGEEEHSSIVPNLHNMNAPGLRRQEERSLTYVPGEMSPSSPSIQTVIVFGIVFLFGDFLSSMATPGLIRGFPKFFRGGYGKSIAIYCLGSILSIAAPALLVGPQSLCKQMFHKKRRIVFIMFLTVIVLVPVVARKEDSVEIWGPLFLLRDLVTGFYGFTYIPCGRCMVWPGGYPRLMGLQNEDQTGLTPLLPAHLA